MRGADGCIRRGNLAVHWEEQGSCDGLAYCPSNWIARQNLLIVFAASYAISFNLMEHSFRAPPPPPRPTGEL